MTQEISIQKNTFTMHPSGGMLWHEKRMLLIADVHLGKVSHFRKHGSAVPLRAVAANFDQLTRVADYYQAQSICFLGDLFHSSLNTEWKLFEKWVQSRDETLILIAGNHDIISPVKYENLDIDIYSEFQSNGFLLTHHPEGREGFFNFCGIGRQVLKLSCFFKTENQLILPAFGTFTGNYYLEPQPGNQVFAITKNEVIPIQ